MDAGCTDNKTRLCECWGGKNHFLSPEHDCFRDFIWDWHPGLDPEVGSSLEYEYSTTRGAAKAGVRSLYGKVIWVVGWVCGRMFYCCEMGKAWSWGLVMELYLGYEWV